MQCFGPADRIPRCNDFDEQITAHCVRASTLGNTAGCGNDREVHNNEAQLNIHIHSFSDAILITSDTYLWAWCPAGGSSSPASVAYRHTPRRRRRRRRRNRRADDLHLHVFYETNTWVFTLREGVDVGGQFTRRLPHAHLLHVRLGLGGVTVAFWVDSQVATTPTLCGHPSAAREHRHVAQRLGGQVGTVV